MSYAPDHRVLARLGDIASGLSDPQLLDKSGYHVVPDCLAILPGGELYLDSNLELDTDGWPGLDGPMDHAHREDTSLRYTDEGNLYINANEVPYFVLPGPESWAAAYGITIGDYGAVLFEDKLVYAVFADTGHSYLIGEGSIHLMRRLGTDRIRPDGSVFDAGIGPGIVTVVFPGSGKGNDHFATQDELLADIEAVGYARFVAAGGWPGE